MSESKGSHRFSVRAKLTVSYAGFLLVTFGLIIAVVWMFLLPDDWNPSVPEAGDFLLIFDRKNFGPRVFVPAVITIFGVLLIIGLAGGWFLAGRMLAPMTRITEVARSSRAGHLGARVRMTDRSDEFSELADAVDIMLDRISAHVAEQERFAANAAHELRTPLATTAAILAVARDDPDRSTDPATARDLARLRVVNDRAVALTEDLLLLSRAGRIRPEEMEVVDLSLLAEEAEETLLPMAEAHGVDIIVEPVRDAEPLVTGSVILLGQLVVNLLQNAIVHNSASDSWVRVSVSTSASGVTLRVENPGSPVDQATVGQLTEPFRRGDRSRPGGTDHVGAGLGLAVVQRIVTAHGGVLDLAPRVEGGLTVSVTFPEMDS